MFINQHAQQEAVEDALAFADAVNPNIVRRVLFFGSVARGTALYESDVDVVLVVSEEVYRLWVDGLSGEDPDDDAYYGMASRRLACATPCILSWVDLPYPEQRMYDVFLLPEGFENRLDELRNDLWHEDEHFMRNIAQDLVDVDELRRRNHEEQFVL